MVDTKKIKEARAGRIQIAQLQMTAYEKRPENDDQAERRRSWDRVVITIGKWDNIKRKWNNETKLWLSYKEFALLKDAIEEFDQAEVGAKKAPASKVHSNKQVSADQAKLEALHKERQAKEKEGISLSIIGGEFHE